jgi:hypothetical protein
MPCALGDSSLSLSEFFTFSVAVLMPPCKWLDRIIYVAHQGMEHLLQPHLRTWQALIVAHKTNGCTICLQQLFLFEHFLSTLHLLPYIWLAQDAFVSLIPSGRT